MLLLSQENEFLHVVFGFTPKKKYPLGGEHQMSRGEKVGGFDGSNLMYCQVKA